MGSFCKELCCRKEMLLYFLNILPYSHPLPQIHPEKGVFKKGGGQGCLGRKVRCVRHHSVEQMESSQRLLYGGFARTTGVLGATVYMVRPRTLLRELQCTKQGSRAIFATFNPPTQPTLAPSRTRSPKWGLQVI